MEQIIRKRFPTDVNVELRNTFLSDKKIDSELYAYLQSISHKESCNGENFTIVRKRDIDKKYIAENVVGKSVRTVSRHLDILIEREYLKTYSYEPDYYVLPNLEESYLLIPVKTLQFLTDTLTENVVKVYLYLGRKFKYKKNYNFTKVELLNVLGLDASSNRRLTLIDNILICLQKLNLIEYEIRVCDGFKENMVLLNWSERVS